MQMLPDSLWEYICAPVPFIAGVLTTYVGWHGGPNSVSQEFEVVLVDLDENSVYLPRELSVLDNLLPKKDRTKLLRTLKIHANLYHQHNIEQIKEYDKPFKEDEEEITLKLWSVTFDEEKLDQIFDPDDDDVYGIKFDMEDIGRPSVDQSSRRRPSTGTITIPDR